MENMNSKDKKNISVSTGVLTRLRRTPYQNAAAILTLTITLFVFGIVVVLGAGSAVVLTHFETRPQVTAFFKTDIALTESQIDDLKTRLVSTGRVASVKYISKQEALAIYQGLFKDDPILLELVTAKMLPASVEVSSTDPGFLPQISELLKKESDIDQVIFQEEIVNSLTRWTNAIRILGLVIITIFLVYATMVMSMIVSLKIALRKEEIDIINLVGGSRWYIYRPFLIDSLFCGIIGAFLGWFGNTLTLLYATPFLVSFLSGIPIFPIPIEFYLMLLATQLFLGMGIGTIASMAAIRRYLPS
jgi:cell division transport system permease protein